MDNAQPAPRPLDRTTMMLSVFLVLAIAALLTVRPWRRSQVAWATDLPRALAEAKKSGRPVLAEVYASWCGPCRQMERDTFSDSDVGRQLSGADAILLNYDKPEQRKIAENWGQVALPEHVLLRPDGSVKAISAGYMKPDEFLKWLRKNGVGV